MSMRCWGKGRDQSACKRAATTWCMLGNVRFALCDRHASANRDARLVPIGGSGTLRSSAR